SRPTASARGLARALREAHLALRVSVVVDGPQLTHFEDLGLYRLLANADPAELQAHVDHWLGPIIEYDNARSGSMLRTLITYFEHGCALDQTSRALYIHRSTLKYRLRRIEALLHRELADPDSR